MVWFKVDDTLPMNMKVVMAGNAAIGLWVRAGAWCMQQLTDGVIPDRIVATLGTADEAQALVDAGLWSRVDGGYSFHQWDERQPSSVQVEAERAAARERQRRAREKAQSRRDIPGDSRRDGHRDSRRASQRSSGVSHGPPDPTRPDPLLTTDVVSSRASKFDDFWKAYPAKKAKDAARKAWDKAVKREDPGVIVAGASRYAADPNRDPGYTKHPATWLNGGCWNDEPESPRRDIKPNRDQLAEEWAARGRRLQTALDGGFPDLKVIEG